MILTLLLVCRNEEKAEYFEEYLSQNLVLFDNLLAYDDDSSDFTVSKLQDNGFQVIKGGYSKFRNELLIRNQLVQEAKLRFPLTDWFVILDADELLLASRKELEDVIRESEQQRCNGISFHLVNLWKCRTRFRKDELFDKVRKVHAWKNLEYLEFPNDSGLHRELHPINLSRILVQEKLFIIHLGFSSKELIVSKFNSYKKLGQRGRLLWRLLDERELKTGELKSLSSKLGERASCWLTAQKIVNIEKTDLSEYLWETTRIEKALNRSQNKSCLVTLICLIYQGVDWLEFAYGELLLLQSELEDGVIEILFCANDPTDEIVDFLVKNNIPHIIFRNENPNEHYLSRVYRAYNFGVSVSKGDYCLLVNSDMAYSPGFITRLLDEREENRLLVAKLVESGTLKPGQLATKRNFGKNLYTFKREKFYKFASKIQVEKLTKGGLYMPLLVHKQKFLNLGGFPEGNITPESLSSYLDGADAQISSPGNPCISGDDALFRKAEKLGMQHITSFNSIAYHFQEGEKRHLSKWQNKRTASGISFAAELLNRVNNQENIWEFLYSSLKKSGLKVYNSDIQQNKVGNIFSQLRMISRKKAKINPRVKTLQLSKESNASGAQINLPERRNSIKYPIWHRNRLDIIKNITVIVNDIKSVDLDALNHYIWIPYQTDSLEAHEIYSSKDEILNELTEILKQELRRSFLPVLASKTSYYFRLRNKLARPKLVSLND
jgi:hypothetical protein